MAAESFEHSRIHDVDGRGQSGQGLWSLLRPELKRYAWRFVLVSLLLPISSVMAMLVPYLTKVAIDEVVVPAFEAGSLGVYREQLLQLVALAMGVVVVGYLSDAFYVSILQRSGQALIAYVRVSVYQRSLRLPRRYFDTHPIGTVLTRVTSDVEALGESLATGVLQLINDGLKTLAFLGMMFWLNWRLTLVLLVLLPLLVLVIRFFQKRVRDTFFRAREALAIATGFLQECLSGMKTIQLYSAETKSVARYQEKNHRYFMMQNQSNIYDATLFSLVEGITTLALALVLWYSAGELLSGLLTLGVLVAFMEYIQRLFVPVKEFSQNIAVLQRAFAALDHIDALVRVPLDPAEPPLGVREARARLAAVQQAEPAALGTGNGSDKGPEGSGGHPAEGSAARFEDLVFDDVRFRYGPRDPEILKGLSFRVGRGQTLAIVGPTGSGKSTVIRLLMRAYHGYEGSIRLNGRELTDYPAEELGRLVSVVHQGVFLFEGSAAFNVGLERPGLSRAQIEQATRYVHADSFISRLEGGLDFHVGQGGANLSAGQSQLLSFARAVATEPELIVLDEATSSVDSMTEHLIQQAVGRLFAEKSVIAIAHRLSTIRHANTILVMRGGEVAESGNHAELLAQGGLYAQLVGEMEAAEGEAGTGSPALAPVG